MNQLKQKILHLWVSDSVQSGAGTSVAMYRLHHRLRKKAIESFILCGKKFTDDPYTQALPTNKWVSVGQKILRPFTKGWGFNDLQILNGGLIRKHPYYKACDILTIHATHGFINYLALPRLIGNKKAVFVLHDMWALTGHCSFSYDCNKWQRGCGHCPYPMNIPRIRKDMTKWEWKLKKNIFSKLHLTLVSPSTALQRAVKESLLQHLQVEYIPHGIDESIYYPRDKHLAKEKFNLPTNKKIILVSAVVIQDHRKGVDLLIDTLNHLPEKIKNQICIAALGRAHEAFVKALDVEVQLLGFIEDENEKAWAFSAADLFVHPSRAESFGLVVLEAMACGVPTTGFRIMGLTDLIRPNITGLLADYENTNQLRNNIITLIENDSLRMQMGRECRDIVLNEYREDIQIDRYISLYNKCFFSERM